MHLVIMRLLALSQQKYLMRCFKMGCFSKTMIELMHDSLNRVIGYSLKAAAFGKVLPDQTLGMFA